MLHVLRLTLLALLTSPCLAAEPNADPFPTGQSKKGLQVQMVDDAIALGVKHAALNVDLTRLIDPAGKENGPQWKLNGRDYSFSPSQLAGLDAQVHPLSDQGILVYLILLNYASGEPERDRLMLHPNYAKGEKQTGPIAMFNIVSEEGQNWLQACAEFLADRYSRENGHGRVWGYICGNEVNSHWFWANRGHATPEEIIHDYERAVRLIHQSVRKSSLHARVYLSLDHHWNIRYRAGSETQCFGGREFLDRFAAKARENGDFDWHLAHHPYPAPLTDPRFWLDTVHSKQTVDAEIITFRNLNILTDYFQQKPLLFQGVPRRIILSEQGFHCNERRPTGEKEQAAAFVLAYKKVESLPAIDAFILHRHTDHAQEGGLNLGLWTNKKGEICTPDRKRMMYHVFQAAGTPEADKQFRFALPIVGVANWEAALQNLMRDKKPRR